MLNLNDLVSKIIAKIPADLGYLKDDFTKHIKSVLEEKLQDMAVVTQEEFNIQKNVLMKTRKKLEQLEKVIAKMDD
jgi:BMFP domain-containing protein YqiC